MPSFYVDEIEIEPYEYIDTCTKSEIRDLISELVDRGHLPTSVKQFQKIDEKKKGFHPSEAEYENALDKLHGKYTNLSREDEETILKIANKF